MTEILILDYNRPEELFALLKSIKSHCKFEKKVVVLNNGGDHAAADEYWGDGLSDEVIHNSINIGCGAGTVQLFSRCKSEYAFYIQVDHYLTCDITEKTIDMMVEHLKDEKVAYIDVAGNQGNGVYSERAQFINRDFYLTIPKSFGGPGPLDDLVWTEACVQNYLEDEGLSFVTLNSSFGRPIFMDRGRSSVRSNPDGSEWKHFPDTKRVFCLKKPTETYTFPPLSDDEWVIAKAGEWPEDGKIIDAWKGNSFEVWNKL